ncbi:hypothetical protein XH86_03645 [Bradyrhizobium guangdongense]|uniref:Uncharacterized protein n=1 Tax=Bradyrhizobium guangdongense TaxID=1325090 RepID=A0ABX6UAP8_9BRAD|nr:hypothetical protein X265_03650 [Bradyrhizobium guangdongense]QOZ57944.1 hypothetical protein XH86_03645 [Bradyrhizobium guangdongense]
MSTVANLLAQKQQLLERLENDPSPNERDDIERLLAKIETALTCWCPTNRSRKADDCSSSTDGLLGTYSVVQLFPRHDIQQRAGKVGRRFR